MKKVIGIISYLPDDIKIRDARIKKLTNLLNRIENLFQLPVILIAQNYKMYVPEYSNLLMFEYPKLGIVGARRKLREKFLESSYDCLIMLDDDCSIYGSRGDAMAYLQQIDNNPGMFYEFNVSLLKLFAISKEIFKEVDFADVNPEDGEGFEDRIFVETLRKRFPDKRYQFIKGHLEEYSVSTKDTYSTWYTNQDIKQMLKNTEEIIKEK